LNSVSGPGPHFLRILAIARSSEWIWQLTWSHAREKIAKNNWSHLQVIKMDALNLSFAPNSFDYVTAFHTVTVVPDPVRMLAEAKRVCRPGGKIVIVNHFTTDLPIIGALTESLDPVIRHLGWQTKLKLDPEVRVKNAATSPMNTAIAMVFIESPASVASSRPNVPPLPRILR